MAARLVPAGMVTPRFKQDRTVEIPAGEIPLIHPKDAPDKQVRERRIANARVFDLLVAEQSVAHEALWQRVCDGMSVVSEHPEPCYHEDKAGVMHLYAYVRWFDRGMVPPGVKPATPVVPPRTEPAFTMTPPMPPGALPVPPVAEMRPAP